MLTNRETYLEQRNRGYFERLKNKPYRCCNCGSDAKNTRMRFPVNLTGNGFHDIQGTVYTECPECGATYKINEKSYSTTSATSVKGWVKELIA